MMSGGEITLYSLALGNADRLEAERDALQNDMMELSKVLSNTCDERDTLRRALEKAAHETADYGDCPAGANAWEIKDCETCDNWNDRKKQEKCWLQYFMDDSE